MGQFVSYGADNAWHCKVQNTSIAAASICIRVNSTGFHHHVPVRHSMVIVLSFGCLRASQMCAAYLTGIGIKSSHHKDDGYGHYKSSTHKHAHTVYYPMPLGKSRVGQPSAWAERGPSCIAGYVRGVFVSLSYQHHNAYFPIQLGYFGTSATTASASIGMSNRSLRRTGRGKCRGSRPPTVSGF